jgi:Protein of unknown function (DUF3313)
MRRSIVGNSSIAVAAVAAAACLCVRLGVAAPKQPQIQTGPNAEVTADGLVRVQKTVADAAWVKPDFDLTPYTKLMIVSAGASFKKVKPVSSFEARKGANEFPISPEAQQMFKDVMKEEFTKELSKLKRYQIVDQPGPDVLTLVGAVIDIVSAVPSDVDSASFAGRGGVYLSSVGQATLVIELRDSQSNEILGRAADRRAAESPFTFEVNKVTAWTEVHRLAQAWASLLRKRLEEIEKV